MKLLVVYPYFVDTSSAGHSLMYEAVAGLAAAGHEVTVVSGESGYMEGAKGRVPLPWYRRIVRRERVGPIQVLLAQQAEAIDPGTRAGCSGVS